MEKWEFLGAMEWANGRWPNLALDPEKLESLYKDYVNHSGVALSNALDLLYKNGAEFLSLPKLKRLTIEEETKLVFDGKPQLKPLKEMSGLSDYLKANNYKSLSESIFYTSQKLFNRGARKDGFADWQMENFKRFNGLTYEQALEKGWKAIV